MTGIRHSVFVKLLIVMALLGAVLFVIVGGSLWFVLGRELGPSLDQAFAVHAREFANSRPPGLMAHVVFLGSVLLLVGAVVVVAYASLTRVLRPLRALNAAVNRLGHGDLDVVVPNPTDDEFGRLTTAFNNSVRRVREMVRARDQLLLDVSHELRSPLTRLRVALELQAPTEQRQAMTEDVAEMERMIASLLEMERLGARASLPRVSHDLVPLLQDVAQTFQDRSPGVRVTAASAAVPVAVDAGNMRTVIRNLLENAIKYSLPDSRPVEVSVTESGGIVTVGVRDDGIGIPDGDKPRIFEPFFRSDPSRSRKTGGYGLGLSLSQRIVEAYGGAISVEDRHPRGTTMIVTLPANQADGQSRQQ